MHVHTKYVIGIGFTIHCAMHYDYGFLKMKIWVKLFLFLTIPNECQCNLIFISQNLFPPYDIRKNIDNIDLEVIKDFIYHNFD